MARLWLFRGFMSNTDKQQETLEEFRKAVNMAPKELEDFLKTDESKKVGYKGEDGDDESKESVGHQSGERIVEILHRHKADYTDDDYDHMRKVVGYVHRHLAQKPSKEEIETSNWRYSLMNWGHDPLKN